MERTPVNPWAWSLKFSFNQGEVITGKARELICAGQTSVDADGRPQHPGDMAAQLALAVANLEAVLSAADMTLANIVRLNFYTTDVDALREPMGVLNKRLRDAGVMPPGTLLGVVRLAYPELMIELEATAMA